MAPWLSIRNYIFGVPPIETVSNTPESKLGSCFTDAPTCVIRYIDLDVGLFSGSSHTRCVLETMKNVLSKPLPSIPM